MGVVNKAKSNVVRAAMRSVNMTRAALRRHLKVKPRAGSEYLAMSSDAAGLALTAYGLGRLPVALVAVAGEQVVARFDVARATVGPITDAYTAVADFRMLVEGLSQLSVDSSGVVGHIEHDLHRVDEDGEDSGWKVRLGWLLESSSASGQTDSRDAAEDAPEIEGLEAGQWIEWVGRAATTEVSRLMRRNVNGHSVTPLITVHGNLRIDVDTPNSIHALIYADDICVGSDAIRVRGRVASAQGNVVQARFVVVGRETGTRFESLMKLDFDQSWTNSDFGRRHFTYDVRVPISPVMWDSFSNSEPFDAVVEFYDVEGAVHVRRVSRVPVESRVAARGGTMEHDGRLVCVSPYFTFKAKALSFHIECFDASVRPLLNGTRSVASLEDVWLIGEQPWRAGDNGYHFFRWVRREHPEISAYYVISKDSPDAVKFEGESNVLYTGTYAHFEKALQASKFIGTHHPEIGRAHV